MLISNVLPASKYFCKKHGVIENEVQFISTDKHPRTAYCVECKTDYDFQEYTQFKVEEYVEPKTGSDGQLSTTHGMITYFCKKHGILEKHEIFSTEDNEPNLIYCIKCYDEQFEVEGLILTSELTEKIKEAMRSKNKE
jgi:hypothetical protein